MSPEPPAARLFSCFLYLAFLVLLVGMTVMGPFRRVMSKETKFYEGFKSTTELPAPTVTICLVGARKNTLKVHHNFFLSDENETTVEGDFYGLENFYKGAHLRRNYTYRYSPPLWAPKASEWRVTHTDTVVVGNCYHLDLSRKVGPGEPWFPNLAFNHSNAGEEKRGGVYFMLREEEEDFFAGFSSAQDFRPQAKFVEFGKISQVYVKAKIMEYNTDCQRDKTLTKCVEDFLDSKMPTCTSDMFTSGNCSHQAEQERTFQLSFYRQVDYQSVRQETECRKRCLSRVYEMVHSSAEYYADALFDLGPSDTIITISYRHQPQIRYLQEGKTYDFADFYADCGGLSGLLLGFSAYGGIMAIKEKLLQASKY